MSESRASDVTSIIAYASSAFVTLTSGVLNTLNSYAPAFGVIFGAVTVIINWHYQRKRFESSERNRKENDGKITICPHDLGVNGCEIMSTNDDE